MQMDFESKSVEEVGEWLKSEKFSAKIVQDFASKCISNSYSTSQHAPIDAGIHSRLKLASMI